MSTLGTIVQGCKSVANFRSAGCPVPLLPGETTAGGAVQEAFLDLAARRFFPVSFFRLGRRAVRGHQRRSTSRASLHVRQCPRRSRDVVRAPVLQPVHGYTASPQDFRKVFIDVSFGIRKSSQNNASWTSSFSEVRGRRQCSERKRQTWADGRLGDIGCNLVRRGAVPTYGGDTGWLAEKQKP